MTSHSHSTSHDLSHLRRLLALEATYRPDNAVFDKFLAPGELLELDTYEPMIDAGVFDPNIYIVKTGLVRCTYMDKNTEKTASFAMPGSMLVSYHCYYGLEPSFYCFEACCPTTILKISRNHFDSLVADSPEFARWVLSVHQNHQYHQEYKHRLLSGDARTRLYQLMRYMTGNADLIETMQKDVTDDETHRMQVMTELHSRWKEIFRLVPSKIIASYLGITEQHLSKIKREVLLADSRR